MVPLHYSAAGRQIPRPSVCGGAAVLRMQAGPTRLDLPSGSGCPQCPPCPQRPQCSRGSQGSEVLCAEHYECDDPNRFV